MEILYHMTVLYIIARMKIAFVGQPAVGKDAVSEYVAKEFGLAHISSGDIVRKYVTDNNLGSLERKNLQIIANQLRAERGGGCLIDMALEKNPDNVIISGLRAVDEVKTFKKHGGIVISVTAPIEQRYFFAKMRGRIDDTVSFEDFKKIEDEERAGAGHTTQNVDQVVAMADIEIVNDGTLEQLFEKGKKVVEGLKS
jgi:dephospho-CoA kinase